MSQSVNLSSVQPRAIPTSVYIVLFFGVLAISVSSILVKLAQTAAVPSLLIAASRLIIATLLLTPMTLQRYWQCVRSLTRRDFGLALASGLFLALHFASWVTSLEYTSVLISAVFVTSSPLWVAILEFFFLRTRLARLVTMGLAIAISGALLIGLASTFSNNPELIIDRHSEFKGGVLSLIGAVTFAAYLIIGRNLQSSEKLPIIPYIWLVYGSAGLILSVVVLLRGIPLTGYSTSGYMWLLATGVIPQLVGHSSLNYAVGYMSAIIVSMITQLEPVGSAIIAFFVFNEHPLPLQIVGSVIIIAGVMLGNMGQRNHQPKQSETS